MTDVTTAQEVAEAYVETCLKELFSTPRHIIGDDELGTAYSITRPFDPEGVCSAAMTLLEERYGIRARYAPVGRGAGQVRFAKDDNLARLHMQRLLA